MVFPFRLQPHQPFVCASKVKFICGVKHSGERSLELFSLRSRFVCVRFFLSADALTRSTALHENSFSRFISKIETTNTNNALHSKFNLNKLLDSGIASNNGQTFAEKRTSKKKNAAKDNTHLMGWWLNDQEMRKRRFGTRSNQRTTRKFNANYIHSERSFYFIWR